MLYFLYGLDTYRLQKKLSEIKAKFFLANKTGLNLVKLDVADFSFQNFWDDFCQRSMFVAKKLFLLENVFSNDLFKKSLEKQFNEIEKSQNIVVLIEKKEIKKTDKFLISLQKIAKCQEFPKLALGKLKVWVKKEFGNFGIVIDAQSIEALIEKTGDDLWSLSNEIQKLGAYKYLDKKVCLKDVNQLLDSPATADAEIFKTIDVLANKNKKQALQMIDNHLKAGDDPFYLLSMVAYQFRNLIMAKSEQENSFFPDAFTASSAMARKFAWHPFVAKKANDLANRFSLEALKNIYQKILLTDLKIKTGQIGPSEGLTMLVAEI